MNGIEVYARYTPEFLRALMAIWPDPKTNTPGLKPSSLSKGSKLNLQTVMNYINEENPRRPDPEGRIALGRYFGIYFVDDWDDHIDNAKVLKNVKAFLDTYVYKKASA